MSVGEEKRKIHCDQCGRPQEYDGSGLCSWRAHPDLSCDGKQMIQVTEFYDAIEPMKKQFREELDALHSINVSLTERVAAQSELLSKRAEKPPQITRDVVLKYVDELEAEARKIYYLADAIIMTKSDYDTLCDEFQLACDVENLFTKRAAERNVE